LPTAPKSAHPAAKKALAEIYNAENKAAAVKAAHNFATEYGAKWPKAVAKIVDDFDVLTAFYDDPPSTGSTCAPPTRSSRPSRPCGCGNGSPRDPAPAPPAWRWPSNSSNPPSTAGEP
jgi:membrane protein involved in colicin uptake